MARKHCGSKLDGCMQANRVVLRKAEGAERQKGTGCKTDGYVHFDFPLPRRCCRLACLVRGWAPPPAAPSPTRVGWVAGRLGEIGGWGGPLAASNLLPSRGHQMQAHGS